MSFNRDGVWEEPTEATDRNYESAMGGVETEIFPSDDILEAIKDKISKEDVSGTSTDIFGAIAKLKGACDIVIPVYGALHVLKPCVESILKHTDSEYRLIFADDASPDPKIMEYLEEVKENNPGTLVVSNAKNIGFAGTANLGVSAGYNPYICILNSDTLVTKGWLIRMLVALEADERNVIVNPATNNTAVIDVPMYPGSSYIDMADAMAISTNTTTYQTILPTGFCFTLRRELWDAVGPFDEAYESYGEETDFWFKAVKLADKDGVLLMNRAVIADNAYVFHERSTSFNQLNPVDHKALRNSGSSRFRLIHPEYESYASGIQDGRGVAHLRTDLPKSSFKKNFKGNFAWVVKSAAECGGMNFIADIVNQLIEEGYNAKVCVIPDDYEERKAAGKVIFSTLGNLRTAPVLFKSREEFTSTFTQRCFSSGVVFSAVTELSPVVKALQRVHSGIVGYNHVQSNDVTLARLLGKEDSVPLFKQAYKLLPNVCSSKWVADEIVAEGAEQEGPILLPGVNTDLFHDRGREQGDTRFTVAVLMNDDYLFKGSAWAESLLNLLEPWRHPQLRVLVIGPTFLKIRGVTCLGVLSQARMADILGTEVDILIDPAEVHSYGMPGLEALASGCSVITRENRGIHEYKEEWGGNVTVVTSPEDAVKVVHNYTPTRGSGISEGSSRAGCVERFIQNITPDICEEEHRIEVITPHLRKHGGPTTIISMAKALKAIGNDVGISTVYADWHPEVLNAASGIKIRTEWDGIDDAVELVFINSDNPFAERIMESSASAKHVMLKLSHNPRFKDTEDSNLDLPWDHIATSTSWLKDVCLNPLEDWKHKAWGEDDVSVVGWSHYGHKMFAKNPQSRHYGSAKTGFRGGTLIHPHPMKGSNEAMAVLTALKKKYEANFRGLAFGEAKFKSPEWLDYFVSASRADMADGMQNIDVWLGASHSEGLGRMALEAMSAGCCVVTTNTGAEFLQDGENCLLYEPGDMQTAMDHISRVVEDRDLFSKLVLGGWATAEAASSDEIFKDNLNSVVSRVLEVKQMKANKGAEQCL
tara:strand:- start:1328 stop:4462 length:3135 start_codon:yes stop_codon:yes gene_type:complete